MGIGRRIKETDDVQMKETKPARAEITFVPEDPKYTLDDLILPARVREQILDIADYANNGL